MFHLVSYDMKNKVMRVVFVVMLQSRVVLDKVYRLCIKKKKKNSHFAPVESRYPLVLYQLRSFIGGLGS